MVATLSCSAQTSDELIGTWRSDEQATLAHLEGVELPEKVRALFENDFFGKLEVIYLASGHVRSEMDGWSDERSFEVSGQGHGWVDISYRDFVTGEATTRRLWISGDEMRMEVEAGAHTLEEYFARVAP